MKQSWAGFSLAIFFLALLAGCQTIENENAASAEQMLAAAGFQMKLAETPEQLANLQQMTQRKLVPHTKDGQTLYVYADADYCKCVYVGNEKNNQEYQKMSFQKDLADEKETTALLNEDASMNWGFWGPWGPW